jgi:preprotein translocase subunit SecD
MHGFAILRYVEGNRRMNKNYRLLIVVLVVWALVIWADLPGNPGIHIGTFNRTMATELGLDLRGGMRVLLQADLPAGQTATAAELADAQTILLNRSNALGVSEVTFQTSGNNRIVGEFPGLTDTSQVVEALKKVGQLAFVPLGSTPLDPGTVINVDYSDVTARAAAAATTGTPAVATATATTAPTATATVAPTAATTPAATPAAGTATTTEIPTYKALMTGTALSSVNVQVDSLGAYTIAFTLDAANAQIFADYTSTHVGEYLALVLDNKVLESPVVKSAITGGKGSIEGNYTSETANALAVQLRYGALPVPLKVVESEAVGATLGQESVNKSVRAGIIGLIMVMVLMLYFYRLPGLIADLALVMYTMTSFALFKVIPVTLTLPGIAGFVLSIGVAVDANILIFERMKEEMRAGRGLRQAIDLGWKRAWPSIRDSNMSTLITCVILFIFGNQFGATIVKGFSVTLAIGVLVSLFTAIVATRTFLHLVLDNLKFAEHPRWFAK